MRLSGFPTCIGLCEWSVAMSTYRKCDETTFRDNFAVTNGSIPGIKGVAASKTQCRNLSSGIECDLDSHISPID